MFERFSDHAHKVMALANREAQHLNHDYMGTEHVLLALVEDDAGVAADILRDLGIDLRKLRSEVAVLMKSCPPKAESIGKRPFAPQVKKVIEHAIEETRRLQQHFVGTEHLLLGLMREPEGLAGQVLRNLGLSLERVREEVLGLLAGASSDDTAGLRATPQAGKVTAYAAQEARRLNRDYYGTEHLLLGLLADPHCHAAAVLASLGVTAEQIHEKMRNLPGPEDA